MSQRLSRIGRIGPAAAALVASFGVGWGALADPAQPNPPAASEQRRAETEMELRGVEDTLRQSEDQRRAIEAEIESIGADRARLTAELIDTTAKVQDAERGAAAAAVKLASLNAAADQLASSLARRRAVIADVLAALQRMGANPPPAILVKPGDMAEAVRAATVTRWGSRPVRTWPIAAVKQSRNGVEPSAAAAATASAGVPQRSHTRNAASAAPTSPEARVAT